MLIFLTILLVVPHYLFAFDVELNFDLNNSTVRNLGIERIYVLSQPPQFRSQTDNAGSSSTNSTTEGSSNGGETSGTLSGGTESTINESNTSNNEASGSTDPSTNDPNTETLADNVASPNGGIRQRFVSSGTSFNI